MKYIRTIMEIILVIIIIILLLFGHSKFKFFTIEIDERDKEIIELKEENKNLNDLIDSLKNQTRDCGEVKHNYIPETPSSSQSAYGTPYLPSPERSYEDNE